VSSEKERERRKREKFARIYFPRSGEEWSAKSPAWPCPKEGEQPLSLAEEEERGERKKILASLEKRSGLFCGAGRRKKGKIPNLRRRGKRGDRLTYRDLLNTPPPYLKGKRRRLVPCC